FNMPNDKIGEYEIRKGKPTVCVLALTDDNKIIISREFRPGPEMICDDLPSGIIEEDEEPLEAAKRELLEETGYSGEFNFVGEFPHSPYSTGVIYCFVAVKCKKISEPKLDEKEFIEIVKISIKDFLNEIKKGKSTTIHAAYMALDHLKLL
ncbi:MAG TPA: NUDIX hydrolase, partial [Candidatus Nanoarchaeia archaeon]|nr:NUDIX hydrolase [Candidatus Nanoarchaeia archaeon]